MSSLANPVFRVRPHTFQRHIRYNGPTNPTLTYDVLVLLKLKSGKVLQERCQDAMSVPEIGRNVGFRKLFGTVSNVVFRSNGPIEVTLERP